jgi:hypothetical protein
MKVSWNEGSSFLRLSDTHAGVFFRFTNSIEPCVRTTDGYTNLTSGTHIVSGEPAHVIPLEVDVILTTREEIVFRDKEKE